MWILTLDLCYILGTCPQNCRIFVLHSSHGSSCKRIYFAVSSDTKLSPSGQTGHESPTRHRRRPLLCSLSGETGIGGEGAGRGGGGGGGGALHYVRQS